MSHSADHPAHLAKKRTIIKDRVGCVRSSTYNLPAEGYSYGMKYPENPEVAGDSNYKPLYSSLSMINH